MKTIFFILFFILNLSANERVISLSPALTEIIYTLEKGYSLVGTSSYSLYPKEAKELPVIGSYESVHMEKILSYFPTLVVGQVFNQNTLDKLKHFKIKTLKLNLKTLDNIQKSISILGKELNATKKSKELNADIANAITNVKKMEKSHSVMIVYGLMEDLRSSTYVAGHNIFFDDIIKLSGNTNAYTSMSMAQPVLSYENIIALNPDQIIILHSHATQSSVDVKKALKNWYDLPTNASKNGNISIVDEDFLHIPSYRVAKTIKILSDEMYIKYKIPL